MAPVLFYRHLSTFVASSLDGFSYGLLFFCMDLSAIIPGMLAFANIASHLGIPPSNLIHSLLLASAIIPGMLAFANIASHLGIPPSNLIHSLLLACKSNRLIIFVTRPEIMAGTGSFSLLSSFLL
jgi:hypothetical protein